MKSKIYNGAIIGCGVISHYHAQAYSQVPNANLYAVYDKNPTVAKSITKYGKNVRIYKNYEELLNDPNIDFVEILTPHSTHLTLVKEAVKYNKNINLQKVPTVTLEEFLELKEIISQSNIKFRVFENFRYYAPYQFAKQLIEKDKIGKVQIVNIQKIGGTRDPLQNGLQQLLSYKWRIKESENYKHPTIFDDGYHKHSLIEYFLGERVTKVRGWCRYDKLPIGIKADSPFNIQYFTASNKLGTFQSININIKIENNFYPCDEIIEIIGDSGIIKIYGGHGLLFSENHNSQIKQGVYWIAKESKWNFSNDMNLDIRDSFVEGLHKFTQELEGKVDNTFTIEDAESSLKIGIAIVKSLRNQSELVNV